MANLSISDETKGEQLQYIGGVRFDYGTNSPYPGDSQAPVPSANFSIAGDSMENVYRMDNVANVEENTDINSFRTRVFGGRFSTTSDAPVGGMSIAHQSNELNKEIRTWPVTRTVDTRSYGDTSNGRRTLYGALRHWYAECGLTEFGVRGDFLFNTTNAMPGVAYYDHPTMRLTPYLLKYGDGVTQTIAWERTTPIAADPGAPFGVGEKVHLVVKANEGYGRPADGEVTPKQPDWFSVFSFISGKVRPGINDENVNTRSEIVLLYTYASRTLSILERNEVGVNEHEVTITDNVPGFSGTPSMIILTMTRTSATDILMEVEFVHRQGSTHYTYTSKVNLLPAQLALTRVEGTFVADGTENADVWREGVQGLYVVKGDTLTVNPEDEFEINVAYFNKRKWKNIVFPGTTGNAWSMIHELCSIYGLTFNPVYNSFLLNEEFGRDNPWPTPQGSRVTVQASTREMSEAVEVVNYNYVISEMWGTYRRLYKADQVYTVGIGERLEETIQLPEGTSFTHISQPTCVTVPQAIGYWNRPDNSATASIYSVYDDDNLEVDPRSWNDSGGYISLEATENVGELKMIIQAPNNELLTKGESFHISIAGADIPSLLIAGVGVTPKKDTVRIKTGAGKARNLKVIGTTYDNPMVCNPGLAWDVGAKLASYHGTTKTEATGSFPPLKEHSFALNPILKRGSFYRSISVSDGSDSLNISNATRYNPVEWVQDNFKNLTCAQYKAKWPAGTVCREVNISPLGKDHF